MPPDRRTATPHSPAPLPPSSPTESPRTRPPRSRATGGPGPPLRQAGPPRGRDRRPPGRELGFDRTDVRHIVLTHFDADHIGGLSDFPHAQVHVTAAEALGGAVSPRRGNSTPSRPESSGTRWLLHSGDAFYHHGTRDGRTRVPAALRAMERMRVGS
ncbi:MBL fold metallo-hydrolase [Streptomyces mirabilis]|uniref:MBL fold metallo-hydrolase n=1 Tax=Streptomyces mirabilis TaxID=68239 RepID=UPI0021BEA3F6|nr:MBL fold metallo-hydrolase [Streptomyces mirabilis]MCT9113339.1 MBL fold metallo-hydrolase [Streptomyces mirabilis]